ncbi:MAG: hypothetical protein ABRQ39_09920 [Candidatus Eremiobacterota bacterium]
MKKICFSSLIILFLIVSFSLKIFSQMNSSEDSSSEERENSLVRIFGAGNTESGKITNDVVLICSEGTVRGTVTSDCVVIFGKVHLKRGSEIQGDLVAICSSIERDRGVTVKGDTVNIASYEMSAVPSFIMSVFSSWDIVLALIILLFFRNYVRGLTDRFVSNPASSFIAGFLWLIGFIPLIILLAVSIIGILFIPLVPLLYFLGFSFGFAVLGHMIGDKIASVTGKECKEPARSVIGLFLVLIIFKLIALFPVLGGLTVEVIKMLVRTFGLGLFIMTLWEASKRKSFRSGKK